MGKRLTLTKEELDRKARYAGELAEPIYEPIYMGLLGHLLPEQDELRAREARRRGLERVIGKMRLLMKWHGVDPTSDTALGDLAFALALTHVPGMRIVHEPRPRRGRPRNWKAGLDIELLREVELLQEMGATTIKSAIKMLKKDKSKDWHRFSEANLITRHREARRASEKRRATANLLMKYNSKNPSSHLMGGLLGALHSKALTDENS